MPMPKLKGRKLPYDHNKIEVRYHTGDYVLRYMPKVTNKPRMHWQGPYVIQRKLNPAICLIRKIQKYLHFPFLLNVWALS